MKETFKTLYVDPLMWPWLIASETCSVCMYIIAISLSPNWLLVWFNQRLSTLFAFDVTQIQALYVSFVFFIESFLAVYRIFLYLLVIHTLIRLFQASKLQKSKHFTKLYPSYFKSTCMKSLLLFSLQTTSIKISVKKWV